MDFFTNSKPMLITDKINNTFNKMITDLNSENIGICHKIYNNIIYPNLTVFVVILLLILYLLYRYYTYKKIISLNEKSNLNEKFKNTEMQNNGIKEYTTMFSDFDNPNERIARPTFNPSIPISKQTSYVNYLPNEINVINNGKFIDNVDDVKYPAPQKHDVEFQYSGPYYQIAENGLSDDMYKEFVSQNKQNMEDLDNILEQKIYMK